MPVYNFAHGSNPLSEEISPWLCNGLTELIVEQAYETVENWILAIAKYELVQEPVAEAFGLS